MLTFPTKNLFVEGPDCSGKTTLVKNIHELTGYRWHIHDRSQVSRSIFAKMYDRNLPSLPSDLHFEVSDLNNRFVFMLPEFSIIRERFALRGDEIHKDLSSIRAVYDAFVAEYEKYAKYPNFVPCLGVATEKQCAGIVASLDTVERSRLSEISGQVCRLARANNGECYPVQFTLYDDGEFEEADSGSMKYEKEREYYKMIFDSVHKKIGDELAGDNEYHRVEGVSSRRFVYTDDTCISFIQISIRDRMMDFHTVIRSSDTNNVFPYDLKFLYYLASTCYNRFADHCDYARLRFNLNSAHIVN